MENAFVGIIDDLGLAQDNRVGILIEPDMLSDKLADFGATLLRKELAAGKRMVFFGFKAAGLGDVMQQGRRPD